MVLVLEHEIEIIRKICPMGVYRKQSLSRLSAWKIGGTADLIIRPNSTDQVSLLRSWFKNRNLPHVVFGATTNVLFADEGLAVPAIQIGSELSECQANGGTILRIQAGAWVPKVSRFAMQNELSGLEHIVGIPATFGGLVVMNGGSKRLSIGGSILEVESVTNEGEIKRRSAEECDFNYRSSIFQRNDEILTSVTLCLKKGSRKKIRTEMLQILEERSSKFPRKLPNCGSVFKSNPKMYKEIGAPGLAIERVGLKGFQIGGAQISPKHANFIVNNGGATAANVNELVALARNKVEMATGHVMEAEALFINSEGKIFPAGEAVNHVND